MKKLLLLSLFVTSALSFSQNYWASKSTGFSNSRGVSDISIADSNNIWIEVYDGTTPTNPILEFAKSIDGGNTWTNGVIGIPTTATVTSFKAVSATTCYVGANGFGLYKTIDGGLSWNLKTTGLFTDATSFFDFGSFVSPQVGVTVGDPAGGYMEIYRTTDGGDSWVRIPSSNIAPILTDEYAFTNSYSQFGNAIYFFTNKARTYRSLDAGLTWTAYSNPFTATSTNNSPGGKLCLKSEIEGIYYNSVNFSFWKTTDGGLTFTDMGSIISGVIRANDLTFVPGTADSYVSIGSDLDLSARGTSYSCDGGITWENVSVFNDVKNVDGGSSVSFLNADTGFASGFSTSSSVNGIFKYVGPTYGTATSACPLLASNIFSSDKLFSVSPNPTNGSMKLTGVNINQVQITDILGKVISNNSYYSLSNIDLNISEFNSGIYLVKVTNNEGQTSVVKVVKQ